MFRGVLYASNTLLCYQYMHYPVRSTIEEDSLYLYFDGTDFYARGVKDGADPVLKKLGSNSSVSGLYVVATGASTGSYDVTGKIYCIY